ncbi:MAG: SLC13 family permease, partial [Planctomycetia bacterium]|nr:SLC13 family permease [Planctomycetia bacterium]
VLGAYGRSLMDTGQLKQAEEVLSRAHLPERPDWRILSAQGAVADQLGEHPRAQEFYQAALKINPGDPTIMSNLGLSYALSKRLPEGVVALVGAILLFLLPGNRDGDGHRRRALEWREARIDWDIVLLYGGGMALGELCFSTGLAGAIGQSITGWIPAGDWSGPVLVAVATVVAVVTSEFTSNVASANMVVPVVIALARATGVDPLMPALAATFASSLGFMMPVSTPCNAIVYGCGRVPLRAMMASGAIIDVVGAITVTAAMLLASRF